MSKFEKLKKGVFETPLENGFHVVSIETTCPLLLSVAHEPVSVVNVGSSRVTLRNVEGPLSVDPSDPKGLYKIDIKSKLHPKGERFDDVAPPAPPPPSNMLMAIRRSVKMSMGIIREEFADQGKTKYEIMGDDFNVFEEERDAERERVKKELEEDAKNIADMDKEAAGKLRQPDASADAKKSDTKDAPTDGTGKASD